MRTLTTLFSLLTLVSFAAGRMKIPHRRATDTCANVDLRAHIPLVNVDVQVCACVGQLDTVISGNAVISGAISIMGGLAKVKATIIAAPNALNSTINAFAVPENTTATANAPLSPVPPSVRPLLSRRALHAFTRATSPGEASGAGTTARPTGPDTH
ncbi:hypothetical protein FS749_003378 [Ceratobasidium sp. UAMH 11750]|nr:hypothetical protein FS749_003378 [Ceratobasidium sp. UAMH 11750]